MQSFFNKKTKCNLKITNLHPVASLNVGTNDGDHVRVVDGQRRLSGGHAKQARSHWSSSTTLLNLGPTRGRGVKVEAAGSLEDD